MLSCLLNVDLTIYVQLNLRDLIFCVLIQKIFIKEFKSITKFSLK